MMDCLDVQSLVSDRHGHELIDQHEIDLAMAHCEECPECSSFARALATLDSLPKPVAPDRTVKAALEAVRKERAAAEEATVVEGADASGLVSAVEPTSVITFERHSWSRARIATYASAAAVFVGAVFVTVQMMSAGLGETADLAMDESAPLMLGETADQQDAGTVERGEELAAAPAEEDSSPAAEYVLYSGSVYRAIGPRAVEDSAAVSVGTVVSTQDGDFLRSWQVFSDAEGEDLFLESDTNDEYWVLSPIVRDWEGVTYALTSSAGSLEEFGQWPRLPATVPEPISPDGAPIFVSVGQDERGTSIYVRNGSLGDKGIAIGPGTPQVDPAAGNPNWTWWEPLED